MDAIPINQIREEINRDVYTEHTLELSLFMEAHYRLYVAARMGIDHAKKESSFLNGAYLRIIADSGAELYALTCLDVESQKRYLKHWKEGKPINQFKVKYNGEWVNLSTGFLRKVNPAINKLYEVLNEHIHPSLMYYNRVIKLDADSLFINQDVPNEDLSGVEGLAYAFFDKTFEEFNRMLDNIHPTTSEYRIVRYTDSITELNGQEPIELKVYREQLLLSILLLTLHP